MTRPAPGLTGGQLNVAGILYQMLVSLSQGLDTIVGQVSTVAGSPTVALTVEPFNGGDVQIHTGQSHIVQVKMKSASARWTNHLLITQVLPDLFKAAKAGSQDTFEFVTNNDLGCDDFRAFLAWLGDPTSALDDAGRPPTFRLGKGGKKVSGEALLSAIHRAVGASGSHRGRVETLLTNLTITRRSEAELLQTIDGHLNVLVEAAEDVDGKRNELIGRLTAMGPGGATMRLTQLLRDAHLDPQRLVHARGLPGELERALQQAFVQFRYDPARDIRGALAVPDQAVTVLRSPSGLGKTWRLCATALAMARAGRPVILLRAASVQDLQARILDLVWHTSYGRQTTLGPVAKRLRTPLADARGVWLTVFVDDLNDPELGQSLLEARWQDHGIDLVISAQPATADWLRQSFAVARIDVPEFSVPELSRYLSKRGVEQAHIPEDVFNLLQKPVLASLYCELEHTLLPRSETEYELLQLFWQDAASRRATSVDHPFDLDRLQLVVGQLLEPAPNYPWPPSSFIQTLDDGGVFRLIAVGIVELDGDRRLSMTHDRLLNWAMAMYLASLARDRRLQPPALADELQKAETIETIGQVGIGRRLGYVLMDLIWLLLAPGRWSADDVAAFLLTYLRRDDGERHRESFFTETLATLGLRGAELLGAMVRQSLDGERERLWPTWIGRALRRIARTEDKAVSRVAVELFESGNEIQAEVGLEVLGQVPVPELSDRLFGLVMTRQAAVAAAEDEQRIAMSEAKARAFHALARASRFNAGWLRERLASETEPERLIQLLWVLLQLDAGTASQLWEACRERLFRLIPPTARVLPQAVRAFADPRDLPRLHVPAPDGADMLFEAIAFDAMARLAPWQAVSLLGDRDVSLDAMGLLGTQHWWLPGLFFRTRDERALGRALRARFLEDGGDNRFNILASFFIGLETFVDDETTDVLLDALEDRLLAAGSGDSPMDRARRLLGLLAGLKTPAALDRVVARRGTKLEHALAELAQSAPPSSSRVVDRDAQAIAQLLALMGGAGFDRMVAAQLSSNGTTTRDYGLRHAVWSTSPDVGAQLDAMASTAKADADENYALMQALAAHGGDSGLEMLIGLNSPVYTHAVDIRRARGGDDSALLSTIRAKAASDDLAENLQAIDLAHFVTADDVLSVTAPLVARAEPGRELAKSLLLLHYHRNRYEAALLPAIEPMLEDDNPMAEYAHLHLAINGDESGRAAVLAWLDRAYSAPARRHVVEVALFLVSHDDTRAGALAALQKLRRHASMLGDLGAEMLEVLAREGDPSAVEDLRTLWFGEQTRNDAGAVRAILAANGEDGSQAFEAAKRLFARSGRSEAAKILLRADRTEGLAHLVTAFMTSPPSRKAAIARSLRWDGERQALEFALRAMAASDEASRTAAAELAGWLPADWDLDYLGMLMKDRVWAVETAALEAATSRARQAAAAELMAAVPGAPKPTQWALLSAICEMADPHILAHRGDELSIWPLLESLPREFLIEAERLIDRRAKALARDLEREDRRQT